MLMTTVGNDDAWAKLGDVLTERHAPLRLVEGTCMRKPTCSWTLQETCSEKKGEKSGLKLRKNGMATHGQSWVTYYMEPCRKKRWADLLGSMAVLLLACLGSGQ